MKLFCWAGGSRASQLLNHASTRRGRGQVVISVKVVPTPPITTHLGNLLTSRHGCVSDMTPHRCTPGMKDTGW